MRPQEDYLRSFMVLRTEKGIVSVTDPQQILVYDCLCGGSKRPGDVANELGISSSTLHFILDKMVDSGLIVRSKPDSSKKEVRYSVHALKIVASEEVDEETIRKSEEMFEKPNPCFTGSAAVANMMESYLAEVGLNHDQFRIMYAKELAASVSDDIGKGSLDSVMIPIRERFSSITGYRVSIYGLNPPTVVFEGDDTVRTYMDMLTALFACMLGNATGENYAVSSSEEFTFGDVVRFKISFSTVAPEEELYVNTSLPQTSEPEKFMIVEIDGRAALLMNDIQIKLVDAIYERPLCVTDVVNAVKMPRSTVTTNLLRMVEEGVVSVFYSESGSVYYGLNCSLLLKRVRGISKDSERVRESVAVASGGGKFIEGYMSYMLASLDELGFDTECLMIVLGAKYMRTVGRNDPKDFDIYFGKMSEIAKLTGLSLDIASVYPLTIGIGAEEDDAVPAMMFAKGMAHQGLEMASDGIFIRASKEARNDMKVAFKEIYPPLSMNRTVSDEGEETVATKKRTSSVRDALRKRNSVPDRPVKNVRYITGIAVLALAMIIVAVSGGLGSNVANVETYEIDAGDGITMFTSDGVAIESVTEDLDNTVTLIIDAGERTPGVVMDGIAYPLSGLFPSEGSTYTLSFGSDVTIVAVYELDAGYEGLNVSLYDFGYSVSDSDAFRYSEYVSAEEYSEKAGGLYVTDDTRIMLEAPAGRYVDAGTGHAYLSRVCVAAGDAVQMSAEDLPEGTLNVNLGNAAVEIAGYYVEGSFRADYFETVTMKFVSTDGGVLISVKQDGNTESIPVRNEGSFSVTVYDQVDISYKKTGI